MMISRDSTFIQHVKAIIGSFAILLAPYSAQAAEMLEVTIQNSTPQAIKATYCKAHKTKKLKKRHKCVTGNVTTIASGYTKTILCEKRPHQSTKKHKRCLIYIQGGDSSKTERTKLIKDKHRLLVLQPNLYGGLQLILDHIKLKKHRSYVCIQNRSSYPLFASYCKRGLSNDNICLFRRTEVQSQDTKKLRCYAAQYDMGTSDRKCKIQIQQNLPTKIGTSNQTSITYTVEAPILEKTTASINDSSASVFNRSLRISTIDKDLCTP